MTDASNAAAGAVLMQWQRPPQWNDKRGSYYGSQAITMISRHAEEGRSGHAPQTDQLPEGVGVALSITSSLKLNVCGCPMPCETPHL
eukprot:4132598-Pleurochrysis_carterae.AAC.1